jgi:enoyl-CoA hydratase
VEQKTVVVVKQPGGWAEVMLNRPDVLNALNLELVNELTATLDELECDEDVRGLIFHGAGDRAFLAGADIGELAQRGLDEALRGINARLFQKVEDFPWPTIAAIHGFALGGGCELALACDIRLGDETAVLGQPEVAIGIIPGAGAPHRLTRTVGPGLARELIFTGQRVDAQEAVRIGLLNRVVARECLMEEARELMSAMLKNSHTALRFAKLALNAAVNSIDRRHQMIESMAQGVLFEHEDKHRRMEEFLERKRKREQERGSQ